MSNQPLATASMEQRRNPILAARAVDASDARSMRALEAAAMNALLLANQQAGRRAFGADDLAAFHEILAILNRRIAAGGE